MGENVCGAPVAWATRICLSDTARRGSFQADIHTVQIAQLQWQVCEGGVLLDQGIFPQGGVIAIVLRDGEVHHDGGHGAAALAPAPARDGTVTARPLRPGGVVAGQAVQGEVRDVLAGAEVQALKLARASLHPVPGEKHRNTP